MTEPSFAEFSQSPACQGFSVDFRLHGENHSIVKTMNAPFAMVPEHLRQKARDFVQAFVDLTEALQPHATSSSPPDQGGVPDDTPEEGVLVVDLGALVRAAMATRRPPTPTGDGGDDGYDDAFRHVAQMAEDQGPPACS